MSFPKAQFTEKLLATIDPGPLASLGPSLRTPACLLDWLIVYFEFLNAIIFIATLCMLDMLRWFDPIPIREPAFRYALDPVEILRLLFIPLSRLPSFLLDPPLPRKPLKKDFLEIPLAIEFITPILPLPEQWPVLFNPVESLDPVRIWEFGGGKEILPLPDEFGNWLAV